jgi:hypothetical protein
MKGEEMNLIMDLTRYQNDLASPDAGVRDAVATELG